MPAEARPLTHEGASWAQLATGAPELAGSIAARFAANLHHVLGTVRADGSPRLSGTEVAILDGEVRLGMMPASQKLRDIHRDPRVELHSAPLERDLVAGDARLTGVLIEEPPPPGSDAREGAFFRLLIRRASLVRVVEGELHLHVWDPRRGARRLRRT